MRSSTCGKDRCRGVVWLIFHHSVSSPHYSFHYATAPFSRNTRCGTYVRFVLHTCPVRSILTNPPTTCWAMTHFVSSSRAVPTALDLTVHSASERAGVGGALAVDSARSTVNRVFFWVGVACAPENPVD